MTTQTDAREAMIAERGLSMKDETMADQDRVTLKRSSKVEVDCADTGWTWVKTTGFHSEFILRDKRGKQVANHYKRKIFVLKVLDFHNGCGEFA